MLAVALLTAGLVAGLATPASAAPDRPLFKTEVAVVGFEFHQFHANGCQFVYEDIDLTYKSGTIEINGCVVTAFHEPHPANLPFRFQGNFVLTAKNRATVTGSVTGWLSGSEKAIFTLSVEEGTKNFKHATGDTLLVINDFFGDVTGTLSPQS